MFNEALSRILIDHLHLLSHVRSCSIVKNLVLLSLAIAEIVQGVLSVLSAQRLLVLWTIILGRHDCFLACEMLLVHCRSHVQIICIVTDSIVLNLRRL